jgi:hypothetical protein
MKVLLEDESGRIRLVGPVIEEMRYPLVTGLTISTLPLFQLTPF